MALWEVVDTFRVGFSSCIGAIVNALPSGAVFSHIWVDTVTSAVITDAILAAMVRILGIQYVNVDKYQGVITVALVATERVPS